MLRNENRTLRQNLGKAERDGIVRVAAFAFPIRTSRHALVHVDKDRRSVNQLVKRRVIPDVLAQLKLARCF